MYSQNNEEQIINEHLPDNGFLLDFGAYDGKTFSNSLRLFERGWEGICIEPSPQNFIGLMNVHKDNPKVTLINAPVTETGGLTLFYDSHGDGISTTELSHKQKWEQNPAVQYQQILLPSITLKQVYEIHNRKFNFVNIDVEGNNFNILKTFPFYTGLPEIMCVEYDNDAGDICAYMNGIGYSEIFRNNENLIFKI